MTPFSLVKLQLLCLTCRVAGAAPGVDLEYFCDRVLGLEKHSWTADVAVAAGVAAEGAEILSGGPEDFVGEGSAPLYYSQLPLLHWVRGAAPSSTGAGAELGVGVAQADGLSVAGRGVAERAQP